MFLLSNLNILIFFEIFSSNLLQTLLNKLFQDFKIFINFIY